MSNKRFYWLKLPEDFFNRNDIKVIESQKNGPAYLIFYLKLLTQSIEFNGDLRFNEAIPFNEDMLSTITGTDIDIVRTAMKLFENLGLIEIYDDKTIYMTETPKMLGSETASTRRSRKSRAKNETPDLIENNGSVAMQQESNTIATNCNGDIELELDKELDIESAIQLDTSISKSKESFKRELPLIIEIFKNLDLKSDAEEFFYYWDSRDWKFGNGNTVPENKLESLAMSWESRQKEFDNRKVNGDPIENKPKWIDKYMSELEEMEG